MKICAIICEFNPFHNGHAYLIERAKEITGCDAVVCVMSGSFTQRGDMCVLDKFTRARHAILGGANAVVELPAPFAVAPAEIFALGAMKIIAAIPQIEYLAFGCESGDGEEFLNAARILNEENAKFKAALEEGLAAGESYIRSVSAAFKACGGREELLTSPNDVLGVEYAKAAQKLGVKIDLTPVRRVGAGYNDLTAGGKYQSAGAIRRNAGDQSIKDGMPDYSFKDFAAAKNCRERFERVAADALYFCDKEKLKRVFGCTEGLENKLKNIAAGNTYEGIVDAAATKRYSKARIKRILCANLLGLYADDAQKFLSARPVVNVLAVRAAVADGLLPLLSMSDEDGLNGAEECARLTSQSYALWRHLNAPLSFENPNEKMILV